MDYTNQYGEAIAIPATDEVGLDDEFFANEMAKLPPDVPRVRPAYRTSRLLATNLELIPLKRALTKGGTNQCPLRLLLFSALFFTRKSCGASFPKGSATPLVTGGGFDDIHNDWSTATRMELYLVSGLSVRLFMMTGCSVPQRAPAILR